MNGFGSPGLMPPPPPMQRRRDQDPMPATTTVSGIDPRRAHAAHTMIHMHGVGQALPETTQTAPLPFKHPGRPCQATNGKFGAIGQTPQPVAVPQPVAAPPTPPPGWTVYNGLRYFQSVVARGLPNDQNIFQYRDHVFVWRFPIVDPMFATADNFDLAVYPVTVGQPIKFNLMNTATKTEYFCVCDPHTDQINVTNGRGTRHGKALTTATASR